MSTMNAYQKNLKMKYVCYYINSKGDNRVKYFPTMEDGLAFCAVLDGRIKRGTCGGYDFMSI